MVETWEFGRAVNVNYTLDKAAVAGAAVNEKAVIEYLQARAQALCDMGLLDEQGMQAILQGRLQKRDSAYEDIENAVNAHWPPRKRKTQSKEMNPVAASEQPQSSMEDITNKVPLSSSIYKKDNRRATIMALGDAFSQAYDNIIYQQKQPHLETSCGQQQVTCAPSKSIDKNPLEQCNTNSPSNNCQSNDNKDLSQKPTRNRKSQHNVLERPQCCVLQ